MGNSLVGDSSHAAGAPGLLHGPQEEFHQKLISLIDLRSGKSTR